MSSMGDLLGHSTDGWSFPLLRDNGAILKITHRYLSKFKDRHPLDPFKWASRSLIKLHLVLQRKTEKNKAPLKWSYHPESYHVFPFSKQEGLWPCTSQPRPLVKIVLAGFGLLIWYHPPLNCSSDLTYQYPPSVTWEQTLIHSSLHFGGESLKF